MLNLYPYQREIVDHQYKDSIALFMQMGTGKTFVSMGMFEKSKCSKLLVICLATKVQDWTHDTSTYLGLDTIPLNKGTAKNKDQIGGNALVVGFESAWRLEDDLLKWVDDDTYIIIDESHKIKNHKSKIGKYTRKLAKKTPYKAILTGTPQSKGYVDYYNQLYFLGIFNESYKKFEDKFCVIDRQYFNGMPVKAIVGYKNTDELDKLINENAVYFDREISNDFIPSESTIKFKKPTKYKKILNDRVYTEKSGDVHIYDTSGSLLHASRQLASGYIENDLISKDKLNWIKDFVESLNDRLVIFYNFNKELEYLKETLKDYPLSFYNGEIKDLTNFKENQNGIALVNFASGSTGINDLVISNTMIMFSPTTSYIDYVQSKKRIDRIGQTKKPMYYYLVMENSIDSRIYNSLSKGSDFDEQMFDKYVSSGQF